MADAIARNVENVLGNADSLDVESYENNLEAPSFTKPENFQNLSVVKEFLKGNHNKIADLKKNLAICKTKYFRPGLVSKKKLNKSVIPRKLQMRALSPKGNTMKNRYIAEL